MIYFLRCEIGKRVLYWGYRMLPPDVRKGVSAMSALGILWAGKSDETFRAAMQGERVDVSFSRPESPT